MESQIEKTLIHPIDASAYKEKTYNNFVSREEFINRTGIFVSPDYFEYIYDIEFKESGVSADEFIQDYEEKYSTCIQEIPLQGTFKYEVMDEEISCAGEYDEFYEPNIWEILNSLARSSKAEFEKKYDLIEKFDNKYKDITKRMLLLTKILKNLQLCSNILSGLLGHLAKNKVCAEEIVGNQFLKDIWDISLNQIKMLNKDIGEKCRLYNQDNKTKEDKTNETKYHRKPE